MNREELAMQVALLTDLLGPMLDELGANGDGFDVAERLQSAYDDLASVTEDLEAAALSPWTRQPPGFKPSPLLNRKPSWERS